MTDRLKGIVAFVLTNKLICSCYVVCNIIPAMQGVHFLQVFILIGAAQGFLLATAVLKRSSSKNQNWLLGLALIVLSFRLVIYPFRSISEAAFWEFISQFSLLSLLLLGPLIYLFVLFKITGRQYVRKYHLLHLLPFVIYITHLILPVFQLPLCYSYATLVSGTLYGGISTFLVFRSASGKYGIPGIQHVQSRLYSLSLPLLVIPLAIFGLIDLSYNILSVHPATLPYLGLTVLLYRMGFRSMSDPQTFYRALLMADSQKQVDPDKLKQLLYAVESEKVYLDQDLNIQSLSILTGLSRHDISLLTNQGLGQTFNEFINQYRVEEAKHKLLDKECGHLSIEGIGQDSGFKSRSHFNSTFKLATGMSPGAYKKRNRAQMS